VTAAASPSGEEKSTVQDEAADAPTEPIPDVFGSDPILFEPVPEEPLPGEVVTASPLDELAEVTAELDPEELEKERDRVAAGPPEFDIPMVTNDKVMFWLDYYSNRHRESFRPGLVRSGRYLPLFRRIFAEEGLPLDLVYMSHVESAYKTTAYSRARARGLWQFIAGTGRRYGLRIDYWQDERLDPVKSTRAAAAYLKDLYAEFDDWYLALAAYNAGEGKIRSAVRRTGSRDFWKISRTRYIRRETRNYVPAILAATLISKEPAKYGFDFEPDSPVEFETIEVEGAADLRVLAECAGSDFDTLRALNPALRRFQTPPGATTAVHVPPGSGERTLAALERVPRNERVLYVRHPVRQGDTLSELARQYGVTVSAIQQANHMGRRTLIRVGQELVIPTVASGAYPGIPAGDELVRASGGDYFIYRVRRGDTLSAIAQRHRTTPQAIAAASGIRVNSLIHPGDRLKVVPGVRSSAEARRRAQGAPGTTSGGGGGSGPVVHTVRRGDTLWEIAMRYRTTVDSLCELNRISRHSTLYPGTRLTVRLN
jgi:membrane-bound lytic murein transglycosylase D